MSNDENNENTPKDQENNSSEGKSASDENAETVAEDVDPNEDAWANALAEQGEHEKATYENVTDESKSSSGEHPNLDVVMEIPVEISMEVGKTTISIRNLLKLSQGSVVELDRFAGDPLDVYVNGNLIAHGEVVVVNEKFGIRLTDVMSTPERIQKLGELNA